MTSSPAADNLADRLKALRVGRKLKQAQLAAALGVTAPSVSAWENGKSLPPEGRLAQYALVFGAPRESRKRPQVARRAELTAAEQASVGDLERELRSLAAAAAREQGREPAPPARATGGARNPFRFPAGQAITIVCSELNAGELAAIAHADVEDPDYVGSYRYGDLDALIDLFGHVRSLNPDSTVKIRIGSQLTFEDRNAHLVLLGGIDVNPLTRDFLTYLRDLPIAQQERENAAQPGSFIGRTETGPLTFRPVLHGHGDRAVLVEDVALFLRTLNPYDKEHTATLCNGMYARGTFAVVRALTDPVVRDRNSEYLADRFAGARTYCILSRVDVVAHRIAVPNWKLDATRLFEWSDADR